MHLDFYVSKIDDEPVDEEGLLVEKPWISPKGESEFPIDVELTLRRNADVEKIEIVAHNVFIPRRVEVLTKKKSNEEEEHFIGQVEFTKRRNGETKNELKSVFLNERCDGLIFRVLEPHIDITQNLSSLVSLVRVKIMGKYIAGSEEAEFFEGKEEAEVVDTNHKYSDEIEGFIRAVERNKLMSVTQEDFKTAKLAQLATRQLTKAKKEMMELERDKQEAVDQEDFERAHDLQDEISALRANVISAIDPKLLENTMDPDVQIHRPKNLFDDEKTVERPKLYVPVDLSPTEVPADPIHLPIPRHPGRSSRSAQSQKTKRKEVPPSIIGRPSSVESVSSVTSSVTRSSSKSRRSDRPSSADSMASTMTSSTLASAKPSSRRNRRMSTSSSRRHSIQASNRFLEKENMIVPAALNRRLSTDDRQLPISVSENIDDVSEEDLLESVPPKERPNVRSAINIFDLEIIAKLYSKSWEHRAKGIDELQKSLEKFNATDAVDNFPTVSSLVDHILKEPLYNVYKKGTDLYLYICNDWMPKNNLEKKYPHLATDTHETLGTRVISTLILRNFYPIRRVRTIMKKQNVSLLEKNERQRALLLEKIIKKHEIPDKKLGLGDDHLALFGANCMQNTDQTVRNIGKDMLLALYKAGSTSSVSKQLRRFAESDSNNPAYRKLTQDIYAIDGTNGRAKKRISFKL